MKSLLDAYIQLDPDQKTLVTSEFIKQVYDKVELPERARIEAELKEGQKAQDIPDLVAKVFKLKKISLSET